MSGTAGGDDLDARARELARRLVIVDAHVDVPYRLHLEPQDVARATASGNFDWPRARRGGLDAAFLAIFVPPEHQAPGRARAFAEALLDRVDAVVAGRPDRFALVRGPDELVRETDGERVLLALGIENGAALEGDLANLRRFRDRGVRYVTLTHARANAICDSSFDRDRPWGGLSPFGRDVVRAMNRLGLMIDVSHVSDAAFDQVLELSAAPVLASHSSCRAFTPGWERNLDDERIRRLADAGGVVQVNFGAMFVDDACRRAWEAERDAVEAWAVEHGTEPASDDVVAFRRAWRVEHPVPRTSVARVADHVDHVVALAGADHVGFGSDFDGVGDALPAGLDDVSCYPGLIRELLGRGYGEDAIARIASGNLLRVWRAVERGATE